MKKKLIELNVDFIGGQGPLTKEEEQTISDFIRKGREKLEKQNFIEQSKIKKKDRQPA